MPSGASANSAQPSRDELTRLADDLASTLRRGVEACWEALLDDPAQLGLLAERLADQAGPTPAAASPRGAGAEDFAAVVDAIGLLERRLAEVEDRMRVLAEVTATVARAVEGLGTRAPAGGEGEAAVSDGAETAEP
jgi:hypothetical protein